VPAYSIPPQRFESLTQSLSASTRSLSRPWPCCVILTRTARQPKNCAPTRRCFLIGYEQQKMLGVRLNHSCNRGDDSTNRFSVEFSNFRRSRWRCDHAVCSSGRFQPSANERSLTIAVSCVSEVGSSSRIVTSARRTPATSTGSRRRTVPCSSMTASAIRIIDFKRIPQRQHLQTAKDNAVAFDDIPGSTR